MVRFLSMVSIAILLGYPLPAQVRYVFSHSVQAYVPLSGAISVNGNTVWDQDHFTVPVGFKFNLNGVDVNSLLLWFARGSWSWPFVFADTGSVDNYTGFSFSNGDLIDRGSIAGNSRSPIRYIVTGASPYRVFKLEIANAGFYREFYLHNTLGDSLNIQVWLYETSNVVELRYGPSRMAHTSDKYFVLENGPLIGFTENSSIVATTGNFLRLVGDPSEPSVDSDGMGFSYALYSWPPNGMVYRFSPKAFANGVLSGPAAGGPAFKLFPTVSKGTVSIYCAKGLLSDYEIRSETGRVVQSGKLTKESSAIDVSGLPEGPYFFTISNSSGVATKVFVRK